MVFVRAGSIFVQAESNDISCGDVPHIAEVSDVENLSILPFEFHEVTGLGVFGICENGGHLAAFHPRHGELPVADSIVAGEERTSFGLAPEDGARGLIYTNVFGQK